VSGSVGDPTLPPEPVSIRDEEACHIDESQQIFITVHLWSTWLEVAIEHAEEARRARDEMTRLRAEGKEFAVWLGSEFRASVVAVAASAHALDALYGSTVIPESARGYGPNRPAKIREALKRVFDTGPVNTPWVTQFDWLFDLRDAVVHAGERPAPPVPHPAAGNTAAEHVRYSVESAEQAVDFALSVFQRCVGHPRPDATSWADIMRPLVDLMERRRSWSST
jgi:hypothetical protein